MNDLYDKAKITAYLLGSLPAAEAENFDELSFTDDRFAEHLSATEKDLVDAFVNEELTGTTLEQFKVFYLASPVRREKVRFAQTFQEFAEQQTVAESPLEAAPPKRARAGIFSGIFTNWGRSLQWGFAAASLVLMFFGGWLVWENSRLRAEMQQAQTNRDEILRQRETELRERETELQNEIAARQKASAETEKELAAIREEREKLAHELNNRRLQEDRQIAERQESKTPKPPPPAPAPRRPQAIVSFILTPSLRGNNQLPALSIPPQTDSAAFGLELEADDYGAYRVTLQNQADGKILWQSGKIKSKTAPGGKVLNLRLPARLLQPQVYFLEVSGIPANGTPEIISNYPFRIVR